MTTDHSDIAIKDTVRYNYRMICFTAGFGALILALIWFRATPVGITRFIVAGSQFVDVQQLPVNIHVMNGPGYDGQFYFRLALDPFCFSKTAYGITLDNPEWRCQRILYPLLCHFLSFGNPVFVPFAMIAVNALAMMGILWLVARLTRRFRPVLAAALLGGLWISFARDCTEITAILFVLLCWQFYLNKALRLSVLCGILAVFAKETAIVAVSSVWIWEIIQSMRTRRFQWMPAAGYLMPALLWLIWKIYLHVSIGAAGISGSSDFSLPFAGIVDSIRLLAHFGKMIPNLIWMVYFSWILWAVLAVALDNCSKPCMIEMLTETPPLIFFAFCTFMIWGIGFLLFSSAIWRDYWGFMRVSVDFQIASILLLSCRRQSRPLFDGYSLLVGLNTFILIARWP